MNDTKLETEMDAIHASVPGGITKDQLLSDIEMLLDDGYVDIETLIKWVEKIDAVTFALNDLANLVEKYMPHKTNGHCYGLNVLGKNPLLSMMMDIHYTQQQFSQEINTIKIRVLKILQKKEQFKLFK